MASLFIGLDGSPKALTEATIELCVERMMDRLDRVFMASATMTQADYDQRVREIAAWSDAHMAIAL